MAPQKKDKWGRSRDELKELKDLQKQDGGKVGPAP